MPPANESILTKYFYPVGFAVVGFTMPVVGNFSRKRPVLSGLQKHIAYSIIGGIFGYYLDRYYERRWMERDAVYKHYIELHPDDFVERKRKYKEILEEWCPVR